MKKIKESELIINPDGSIFHLHLKPEDIADTVLLVGDPERVDLIVDCFDSVEITKHNREFYAKTGIYREKRFTVLSTGIGTDNIDIVVTELDALVNIDLQKRKEKVKKKSLDLIRIGTSGAIQKNIPINTFLLSEKSIGFDGMINFYAERDKISDMEFEDFFKEYTDWNEKLASPYVVDASKKLLHKLDGPGMTKGVTISANGFYGPQGRVLRLQTVDKDLNKKIASFEYKGYKLTNYEMESSALFGLSKMLGHDAACVCLIIANRVLKQSNRNYKPMIKKLAKVVLDTLCD